MNFGSFSGGLARGLQNGMSLVRQKQQYDADEERAIRIKSDREARDKTRADIAAIPTQVYNADGMAQYDRRVEAVPTYNPVLDRQGWMVPTSNYSQPVAVPLPAMERPISQAEYMQRLAPILIQGGDYGTGLQAIQYGNVMNNQNREFDYRVSRDGVLDGRYDTERGDKLQRYAVVDGQWQQKYEQDDRQFNAGLSQRDRHHNDSMGVQRAGQAIQANYGKVQIGTPYVGADGTMQYPVINMDRTGTKPPSMTVLQGGKAMMPTQPQNQAIGPEALNRTQADPVAQARAWARQQISSGVPAERVQSALASKYGPEFAAQALK